MPTSSNLNKEIRFNYHISEKIKAQGGRVWLLANEISSLIPNQLLFVHWLFLQSGLCDMENNSVKKLERDKKTTCMYIISSNIWRWMCWSKCVCVCERLRETERELTLIRIRNVNYYKFLEAKTTLVPKPCYQN